MNKNKIVEYVIGMTDANKIANGILDEMQDSIMELEVARSTFDNVSDPKLVEAAIYAEKIAKLRYAYLLDLAKKMDIKVSDEYILDQCAQLVE